MQFSLIIPTQDLFLNVGLIIKTNIIHRDWWGDGAVTWLLDVVDKNRND